MRKGQRPHCLWCKQRLVKHFAHMSIPMDRDAKEFLSQHPALDGRSYEIADTPAKVKTKQQACWESFNDRMKRAKEAQANLAKMPEPDTMQAKQRWRWENDFAEEPDRSRYTYTIRVWLFEYGYDGKSLFHCKECARRWANEVAGKLRKEGKI